MHLTSCSEQRYDHLLPVVRGSSENIRHRCCSAVLLFCWCAVLLFCCSAVLQLFCCSAGVLFCCSAVLLFCCSAVLLFCCFAVLLFCCSAGVEVGASNMYYSYLGHDRFEVERRIWGCIIRIICLFLLLYVTSY